MALRCCGRMPSNPVASILLVSGGDAAHLMTGFGSTGGFSRIKLVLILNSTTPSMPLWTIYKRRIHLSCVYTPPLARCALSGMRAPIVYVFPTTKPAPRRRLRHVHRVYRPCQTHLQGRYSAPYAARRPDISPQRVFATASTTRKTTSYSQTTSRTWRSAGGTSPGCTCSTPNCSSLQTRHVPGLRAIRGRGPRLGVHEAHR